MSWEWLDRLVEIERGARRTHPELRVYRWRPTSQVQVPCVFNWLMPSQTEKVDECTIRDKVRLQVVVLVRHTENRSDMGKLEDYLDAIREPLDAELYTTGRDPLGLRIARRTGIVPVVEQLNEITYPGMAYQLELWVDHLVNV